MPHKREVLRLHTGLPKAYISILTQIRTGKIGLAAFLHKCRVPGFPSPACPCGWQWEMAKHVILECSHFSRERQALRQTTPHNRLQTANTTLPAASRRPGGMVPLS